MPFRVRRRMMSKSRCGSGTAPAAPSATSREVTPVSPRRRSTSRRAGRSARLDNFKTATVWAGRRHRTTRARGGQDKGQRAELAQFVKAALAGTEMPISD